ncbi:ATP-dependent RecD-like DNA helicase [Neochlamydia sp. AcF65]|nr:ATP-dependent RecD-like DNA helicase [Neochlamydia sp. AcF65]
MNRCKFFNSSPVYPSLNCSIKMFMEIVVGYIERITFQNAETGYTVAQLKTAQLKELVCVVGVMPTALPGVTARCKGHWKQHLVHGRQFICQEYQVEAPADLLGIKKYLGSGLIKGIGPKYAERIVEKFGIETLDVIDQASHKLLEIEGLGEKRIEKIRSCWDEQKSVREVMIFLQSKGVSPVYAQKIYKNYGNHSIEKVQQNPYILAQEITGIGFKTADAIAKKMGMEHDASPRIDAGIEFILSELSKDGHVCFPLEEFVAEASEKLEVESPQVKARISSLKDERRIELFDLVNNQKIQTFIWNMSLFVAESGIAREIKRLNSCACNLRAVDIPKALEWVQLKLNIKLANNQSIAIKNCLYQKLHIITGGPGTGKSTITNAILAITEKLSDKILLMAPTGRAAKRMSEITGKKASTIHSILEYNFKNGGFKRNRENPLDCDLLIVDEASMIDTFLMYSLLKAIPNTCRLIFVGDINQLPSVGPGNVLSDMINSQTISVTLLTEIYRQAAGSRIITNAHKINSGIFPDIHNHSESDFFFLEAVTPEEVLKNIIALIAQRLPQRYGYDPLHDIQVLTPMRKGIIGADNLNTVLQETLNKNSNPLFRAGRKLLVGDKVMQIRNDYKKEVYNGEIGVIKAIDILEQQVLIQIEDRDIIYEFNDLDEIVLAYAVSVHKYQGSQCPCIIMPVHTTHFALLYRNLLYTGVTRGQKHVIIVGSKKAIAIAIKNDEVKKRHTGLYHALIGINNISVSMP